MILTFIKSQLSPTFVEAILLCLSTVSQLIRGKLFNHHSMKRTVSNQNYSKAYSSWCLFYPKHCWLLIYFIFVKNDFLSLLYLYSRVVKITETVSSSIHVILRLSFHNTILSAYQWVIKNIVKSARYHL